MHYQWGQTAAKKRERGHFKQCISSKKQCNFDSGCLEQKQSGLYSFF